MYLSTTPRRRSSPRSMTTPRLWVMVSGPYGTGARSDVERAENLRTLNRAAVEVFRRGHVPIVGINLALPMLEVAGPRAYDELILPLSLAAAERCDVVLRIGGDSVGADAEVAAIAKRGGAIFRSVDELPLVPR
jgi:hypothetical protein